jgi:hypothetical protein
VPLASKTALFFSLQVTKISLTPVGECVELWNRNLLNVKPPLVVAVILVWSRRSSGRQVVSVTSWVGRYRLASGTEVKGAWVSVVVKVLRYKSLGPAIDPRWSHWGFFPGASTVPRALGSTQPVKMSTRLLLRVKAAGA